MTVMVVSKGPCLVRARSAQLFEIRSAARETTVRTENNKSRERRRRAGGEFCDSAFCSGEDASGASKESLIGIGSELHQLPSRRQHTGAREAAVAALPTWLHPALRRALERRGVAELYSHQKQAVEAAHAGRH